MSSLARIIVDVPTKNPDLFYQCRLNIPDPIIFVEHRKRTALILSDLEYERGKRVAQVDTVLSLATYAKRAQAKRRPAGVVGVIIEWCREQKVSRLQVPASTSAGLVDQLRQAKLRVETVPNPFYPNRFLKTAAELKAMQKCQRTTFRAIRFAEEILRKSTVRRGTLYWRGKILSSERMKADIASMLLYEGFYCPDDMIISCGRDTTEPHNYGGGPLKPHQAIIVDIFPRSLSTFYYGDATRTFCVGKAPPELKRMYNVVKQAQVWALKTIRAGMDARNIHRTIVDMFEKQGYKTGEQNGRKQGFIHSTGHGIGLDIHEEPLRIAPASYPLKTGHVVTIEPGLYYEKIGGVRIEDTVYLTKSGAKLLATYPKQLEIV